MAANTALWLGSARQYRQWKRAAKQVAATQRSVLLKLVKNNAGTVFGREHGFAAITSVEDYQRSVPLCSYADLGAYIRGIAEGENNLLTAEEVSSFAPTSGSTSASKLIPYTRSLKQEFQRGINPWIFATYARWPRLLTGKQYWSISPMGAAGSFTSGGIPVGFEDDGEYLSSLGRRVLRQIMVVPPAVRRIQDPENFRYATLRFLLQCPELSLFSVWNPTFLALMLEPLPSLLPGLLADLADGTLQPPGPIEPGLTSELAPFLKRDPSRAKALRSLFDGWQGDAQWRDQQGRSLYEAVWPGLALISCWADAQAAEYLGTLRRLFPNTPIQPKGLLATEGIVSFPLGSRTGGALSVNSHFMEFVPGPTNDDAGTVKLAHELDLGEVYSVVITTGGGLYRYRTHDLIDVTGFIGVCPLVRFLGKEDSTVDLFGEKLNESHVRQIVTRELLRLRIQPVFWMLAPEKDGDDSAHYTLFVQWHPLPEGTCLDRWLVELANRLDERLKLNFHYRHCRQLGQLNPAKVYLISNQAGDAHYRFLETCQSMGQRLGDVKPTGLHRYTEWASVFPGRYAEI